MAVSESSDCRNLGVTMKVPKFLHFGRGQTGKKALLSKLTPNSRSRDTNEVRRLFGILEWAGIVPGMVEYSIKQNDIDVAVAGKAGSRCMILSHVPTLSGMCVPCRVESFSCFGKQWNLKVLYT